MPIYLNYIGAEGYGLIGIFASLQSVLLLLDGGLSITLNKELSRLSVLSGTQQQMRNIVKTLGTVYWGVAILAGIIAICLAPILAKYWVKPESLNIQTITYAFILLSISLTFQFPAGFYSGGLAGLQRLVMLNALRILFATLRSVGALLVLIFVSKSILAFFAWTLFVAILQAFSFRYFLWYYMPKTQSKTIFDRQELKNIWRFAFGMIGISLTAMLLTQVDKIILSKILTLEQFGYYTISCTLGAMLYQIINPLTQSYFPKISSLISLNRTEELKNIYHQSSQLVSVLVFPATLILIFFSKELIFIWTHNQITVDNTWLVTSIYALGTGISVLLVMPYLLTLAYSWTKMAFYQNLVLLFIMIPLTIYLAHHYGAIGGALSWALINVCYFLITPTLIHNKFLKNEKFYWYWQDCLRIALVSTAFIFLAKYFLPLSKLSLIMQLIALSLTGIVGVIINAIFAKNLKGYIIQILPGFPRSKV